MYQIFYIDIDEEITSVIDRLRKSKTTENFFVVSPRALILQSVVSLKLLKREAAKNKKQIAIVVGDEEAKMKVEKAGVLALASLKGLEGGEEIRENFGSQMSIENNNKNNYKNFMEKDNKKTRLQKIGTEEFFSDEGKKDENFLPDKSVSKGAIPISGDIYASPKIIDSSSLSSNSNVAQNQNSGSGLISKNTSDVQSSKTDFSYFPEKDFSNQEETPGLKGYGPNKISDLKNMDPYKEKVVEGFFSSEGFKNSHNNEKQLSPKINDQIIPVSHKMRRVFLGFIVICFFAAFIVASYLFLPKAKIYVTTRDEMKKVDLTVKASSEEKEIKIKELLLPAKIIEKEDTISVSYKTTGTKGSSSVSSDLNQKAKGKVTIYNEYGKEPQQLVATTRISTSDGKIFRIIKGVTVPGTKEESGQLKPGSVEVDVIADQAGESYNINPSEFKIPGFKDSPKYDKFYAKSTVSMSGGGSSDSGGSSENKGISIVSQNDLDNAKKSSESQIKDQLEEAVKREMENEYVLLPEAFQFNILESSSSSRVNEATSNFNYTVKGKIKALIFSDNDVKKMVGDIYNEANKGNIISDNKSIKIDYGIHSADFGSNFVETKINAQVPVEFKSDWNDLKKKLLGKNDEQIKEILKEYPQVEKINIDFWPKFMSQKIPQYEKRVILEEKSQ